MMSHMLQSTISLLQQKYPIETSKLCNFSVRVIDAFFSFSLMHSLPLETPYSCSLLLKFIPQLVHDKSPDLQYIIISGSVWVNILCETKAWG